MTGKKDGSIMEKRKNIILIFTDQHRRDTLSCYNEETLCRTPVLDALAKESVRFQNAYTTCPVCSPARSSLMTGLYPSKTGMETNLYQSGCRCHELADTPRLLSRRLEKLGYQLGYTGKWHLGLGKDKKSSEEGQELLKQMENGAVDAVVYKHYGTLPTDIGFTGDDFPGHGNGGWGYPQFQAYLEANHLTTEIIIKGERKRPGDHSVWGEVMSPVESTIEYFVTQRAIDIMDGFTKSQKPFFLALNYWGPHEPFFAPTEFLDQYRTMMIPENPSFGENPEHLPKIYQLLRREGVDWEFFQNTLRHYYACISHIDAQIGRVISYLKEKGIYDDTTIIFSADHGDNQGCHGGLENKSYSMYEDTTAIPLLLKPAAAGFQGYSQPAFVSTCDIYETVLDLAGEMPGSGNVLTDGDSFAGFIDSRDGSIWRTDTVTEGLGAFDVITTQRMYRYKHYKYVFNGAGEDQLFDLESDPYEMRNLAYDQESRHLLLKMKYGLAAWMTTHRDPVRNAFCKLNRIEEWEG